MARVQDSEIQVGGKLGAGVLESLTQGRSAAESRLIQAMQSATQSRTAALGSATQLATTATQQATALTGMRRGMQQVAPLRGGAAAGGDQEKIAAMQIEAQDRRAAEGLQTREADREFMAGQQELTRQADTDRINSEREYGDAKRKDDIEMMLGLLNKMDAQKTATDLFQRKQIKQFEKIAQEKVKETGVTTEASVALDIAVGKRDKERRDRTTMRNTALKTAERAYKDAPFGLTTEDDANALLNFAFKENNLPQIAALTDVEIGRMIQRGELSELQLAQMYDTAKFFNVQEAEKRQEAVKEPRAALKAFGEKTDKFVEREAAIDKFGWGWLSWQPPGALLLEREMKAQLPKRQGLLDAYMKTRKLNRAELRFAEFPHLLGSLEGDTTKIEGGGGKTVQDVIRGAGKFYRDVPEEELPEAGALQEAQRAERLGEFGLLEDLGDVGFTQADIDRFKDNPTLQAAMQRISRLRGEDEPLSQTQILDALPFK